MNLIHVVYCTGWKETGDGGERILHFLVVDSLYSTGKLREIESMAVMREYGMESGKEKW